MGAAGSGGGGVLGAGASFGGGASPVRERFTNQRMENYHKIFLCFRCSSCPDRQLHVGRCLTAFERLRGQEHEWFIIIVILQDHVC